MGVLGAGWCSCTRKGIKPLLGAFLCEIQGLAIHWRGRAGTCQVAGVTVNILRHRFKQFSGLYILLNVIGSGKMYNPEKCNTMSRRVLTVTI